MIVKVQRDGHDGVGLQIGEANARRHFSPRSSSIELRLGDLRIECTLPPEFWKDRPAIHDPRLSVWLEFKAARRSAREPMELRLIPVGPNAFVLRPPAEVGSQEVFGAEVTRARKIQPQSVAAGPARVPAELSVA